MATFNATEFNFASSADALKVAADFGTNEGKHGDGEFKVALLAAQIGARKAALPVKEDSEDAKSVGHLLFFAYAKAKNAAAPKGVKLVDVSNKDTIKNKASLFNAFHRTGLNNGSNTLACIDAIVAKLNSKGSTGYRVDKVRSALSHVVKGKVDLRKVAPIEKGSAKPKASVKPATFDETIEAITIMLKAGQEAHKDRAVFFAGVLKYIEANKSADRPTAKKKNTAQAPASNSTTI